MDQCRFFHVEFVAGSRGLSRKSAEDEEEVAKPAVADIVSQLYALVKRDTTEQARQKIESGYEYFLRLSSGC